MKYCVPLTATDNHPHEDAFDVLLLSTASDIMEVFRSFNAPLVFGAELGCAPDMGSMVMYDKPRRGQPFRFLNSGRSTTSPPPGYFLLFYSLR